MIKECHLCDVCYGGDETVRLAVGKYFSSETHEFYHACATHVKELKGYNVEVEEIGSMIDD